MSETRRLERIEAAMRGIFDRQYYANNGPLVRQFDREFAAYLGVPHAVAVVNPSAALMLAARCLLPDGGEVIVPPSASASITGALTWAGLTPCFGDIAPETETLTAATVASRISERTVGIVGIHRRDRTCDPLGLQSLADRAGLRLIFEATDTLGDGRQGVLGDAEVFSFRAGSALDAAGGAAVTTGNDDAAAMLRTARNFHGSETFADVPLRMNAKMSEAQAALALVDLGRLVDVESLAELRGVTA